MKEKYNKAFNELIKLKRSNQELELFIDENLPEHARSCIDVILSRNNKVTKELEDILNVIPMAIVLVGAEGGKLFFVNKRGMELYGSNHFEYDLQSYLSNVKAVKMDGTYYTEEDMPVSYSLKYGQTVRNVEMKLQIANNRQIPVTLNSAPIYDENGKIASAFVIFEDITERKNAENSISLQAQILSNVQDAIVVFDVNDTIIYCNRALEKMLGWQEHELLGHTSSEFIKFADEKSKEAFLKLSAKNKNRLILDKNERINVTFYRKDNTPIIVDLNMSVLKGPNGEYKGIISSIRDISQRVKDYERLKESEKKSQSLIEQLKKADENKNYFLNMLSHELRNPMASITLGISLMDRVKPGSDKAMHAWEIIKRQSNHLFGLVDDLLDVTRITQNKIILKKECFELNQHVFTVAEDYRNHFLEKEVKLETQICDDNIYIEADALRLTQIIDNLLSNALKFTKSGDVAVVKLEVDEKHCMAVIKVVDSGVGMSKDIISSIFNPFVQEAQNIDRSNGGLGLGLAIVKGMAELHGGSADAFSEGINRGSEFTVRLPILKKKN